MYLLKWEREEGNKDMTKEGMAEKDEERRQERNNS
jgi:hypothetical protein